MLQILTTNNNENFITQLEFTLCDTLDQLEIYSFQDILISIN